MFQSGIVITNLPSRFNRMYKLIIHPSMTKEYAEEIIFKQPPDLSLGILLYKVQPSLEEEIRKWFSNTNKDITVLQIEDTVLENYLGVYWLISISEVPLLKMDQTIGRVVRLNDHKDLL